MIGGGSGNYSNGFYATIGGEKWNTATGATSFIGGGSRNTAIGEFSVITGGYGDTARGRASIIVGGISNIADGDYSVVNGGWNNKTQSDYSVVMGRGMVLDTLADRTFVFGYNSSPNPPTISTPDAFLIGPNGNVINVAIGASTPNARLSILNMGGNDNVSILSMSENIDAEFVFKGDFAGAGSGCNRLRLESFWTNAVMVWEGSGNVGLGVANPGYQLHLSVNSAAKPGTNTWTVVSDARLKQDVSAFTEGLDIIKQINPVWFSYNGKAGLPTGERYVGVIAQELQKVAPYMVDEWEYEDPETGEKTTYLGVDNGAMTYMLINAVKELKAINDSLQQVVQKQKQQITALQEQVQNQNQNQNQQIVALQQQNAQLEALQEQNRMLLKRIEQIEAMLGQVQAETNDQQSNK